MRAVSPLASHYWSTTPYCLGSHKVKYMAVSARAREQRGETDDQHYLSKALRDELKENAASFDFMVHVHGTGGCIRSKNRM